MRPKFSRPIPRLFLRPKFSRPIPRLFFETKYFRDRYRDFFSRLNIFETDTETFFRDQNFRDRDRYSQKLRKVSIPRSLETRCHTLASRCTHQLKMPKHSKTMIFLLQGAMKSSKILINKQYLSCSEMNWTVQKIFRILQNDYSFTTKYT